VIEAVRLQIQDLPDRPGIYLFKGADGKFLYVGKAKSLRKRAANYLQAATDSRIAAMLDEAVEIDFLVADSEAEALYLENNWIKQQKPRYNIRLRDDKTYPYLKLTLGDRWPRLAFTRRVLDDGAEYYGPYLPAGLARRAIKLAQKLFQVRVCNLPIDPLGGPLPRPCLYHDMRRCLGPCVAGLTSHDAYVEAVERARLFLKGRNDDLVRWLKQEMEHSSDLLEFEEAARLRDAIVEIEALSERRKLSSEEEDDVDVYGVQVGHGHAAVVALIMRAGQVLDRRELFWEGAGGISPERLLDEVLPQIYDRTTFIPKEIHLPVPIEGEDALTEFLSIKKGERVYLRMPSRGPKAERVTLAMHNAEMAFRRRFRGDGMPAPGASALASHLELAEAPRRIEGFDISNLQGTEMVASMVVWEEGRMRKGDYRSFNVRDLPGQDDFAAIRQAVERRYRRRLEEVGEMPDLILIDGGRGQLNAALEALTILGVEETPIVSLAKREEEIYLPGLPEPLRLPRDDQGLRLLQQVRDEAHRFAVAKHRGRRSRTTFRSRLDDLAGIGPRRRRLLLERFGSVEGVRNATREDLRNALGGVVGERVFDELHAAAPAEAAEAEGPAAVGET
jgi:excinuclease ABC subunit C